MQLVIHPSGTGDTGFIQVDQVETLWYGADSTDLIVRYQRLHHRNSVLGSVENSNVS